MPPTQWKTLGMTVVLASVWSLSLWNPETALAEQSKVDVCHIEDNGASYRIPIDEPAYEIHVAHGDGGIGEPVPGMPEFIFDADCNPVCCSEFETAMSTAAGHSSTTLEEFDFDERLVQVILPARFKAPAGFKATRKYPLIIHLHSAGIDSDFVIDALGLDKLGLKNKVIVVVPNGSVHPVVPFGFSGQFWNATTACCGFEYAFGPQVDDVDYLTRLLDEVQTRYPIDDDRVYFTGESNGGNMSYRMACDLADRIAGIWVIAGATHLEQSDCNPSRPVNVLHMHNVGDPTALFDGGQLTANPLSAYPGVLNPFLLGTLQRLHGRVEGKERDPQSGRTRRHDHQPAKGLS